MSEPGKKRDPYALVCQAGRKAIDRALYYAIAPLEVKALLVVIDLTAFWSLFGTFTTTKWIASRVYDVDLADVSDDQRLRTGKALRHLRDLGIIGYETTRGTHAGSYVELPLGPGERTRRGYTLFAKESGASKPHYESQGTRTMRRPDTGNEAYTGPGLRRASATTYEDEFEDLNSSTRSTSGRAHSERGEGQRA